MWMQGIENARREAHKLLYRFGVEDVQHVDVCAFADRLGIRIVDAPLEGALAQLVSNGRRTRILLSHRLTAPASRRAAIAHELAHYVLDHPAEALARMCTPTTPTMHAPPLIEGPRDFEMEANTFALELLAPACAIESLVKTYDPGLMLCHRVATATWVPLDYAAVRVAEISRHACATVLTQGDQITTVVPSHSFGTYFGDALIARLRSGMRIDPRTLAAHMLARSMPCAAGEVPAEAWLGRDGLPLIEDSAPFSFLGGTVTTLWAAQLEASLKPRTKLLRARPRAVDTEKASPARPALRDIA